MRACVVETISGVVINVIKVANTTVEAPIGCFLVYDENAAIGWKWDGTVLFNPIPSGDPGVPENPEALT